MTTRHVPPAPSPVPRLSERDHLVLHALWDHYVLTTGQIAQLAYPNQDRARRCMLRLTGLGAVERFRPLLPPGAGTAPMHYTIGKFGAHIVAVDQGIPFPELGYRRDRILAWARSRQLPHLLGVNGFFTSLAAVARRNPGAELEIWWPQRRCATTWAPYIRPDGFGRWREDGVGVDFFFEYDTGSERPLKRVVDKLRGYARMAADDGYTTPVLIWTSTPGREANLLAAIGTPPIPVFTTTADAIRDPRLGPAGAIWMPADRRSGGTPRIPLITLSRYARPFPPTGDDDADT